MPLEHGGKSALLSTHDNCAVLDLTQAGGSTRLMSSTIVKLWTGFTKRSRPHALLRYGSWMTNAPFRLLTHDEFHALTVDEKIAYIAKATAYLEHQRRLFEQSVGEAEHGRPQANRRTES